MTLVKAVSQNKVASKRRCSFLMLSELFQSLCTLEAGEGLRDLLLHSSSTQNESLKWQQIFQRTSLPVLVYAVCSLVQGQGFDLVLADLAGLRLEPGRDVSLQGPILSLNRSHLEHNAIWMKHTSLFYYLQRMMKPSGTPCFYNLQTPVLTEFWCMCYLELKSGCVSLTSVCGQEEVPIGLLKNGTAGNLWVCWCCIFVPRSKTAHLRITFTETDNSWVLIHIQQVYWNITLQKTFIFRLHVPHFCLSMIYATSEERMGTSLIKQGWTWSRPEAADCRWQSAPPEWGCSWHRPGRGWTCHWC